MNCSMNTMREFLQTTNLVSKFHIDILIVYLYLVCIKTHVYLLLNNVTECKCLCEEHRDLKVYCIR